MDDEIKPTNVELLVIGDELLRGEVQEANAFFLAGELEALGVSVDRVTYLPDNIEEIARCLSASLSSSVICCGGLGPTSDDLTRYAIADFVGYSLVEDKNSFKKLVKHAENRGRALYETSKRQALFPVGAKIIENPAGTANAFSIVKDQQQIFCLPGVPSEVRTIWKTSLSAEFSKLETSSNNYQKLYSLFGYSEAGLGQTLEDNFRDKNVSFRYKPNFPVLNLCLESDNSSDFEAAIRTFLQLIHPSYLLGEGQLEFEVLLHDLLIDSGVTIGVAESCTAGVLGSMLTSQAGSSAYFIGGFLTYSNSSKSSLLGVPESLLKEHGAVSGEVATCMAEGVRKELGVDVGVSVTGVAGPGGGSDEKPVGTVWLGISGDNYKHACLMRCSGSRKHIRQFSSYGALNLLRMNLLGLELPHRQGSN